MGRPFGVTAGGETVERVTLASEHLVLDVLTWGATIQRLQVRGPGGTTTDVVLGYPTLAGYESDRFFLGAVVGRYANRIAHGRFDLDGETHRLPRHDAGHTLHGGPEGFHRRVWTVAAGARGDAVRLEHVSPDGTMGFPGTVRASCTYVLRGDELEIGLRAVTDRPTVVNLTQHAYLNLAGVGKETIEQHELWVDARRYLPVDETGLPLGAPEPVRGTPLDFRTPRLLGARLGVPHPQLVAGHGYDHFYVVDEPGPARTVARLAHPRSGRALEVRTDQPGLQLYTGNRLDGTAGHHRLGGVCLETQHPPDAPNGPGADAVVLRPGEEYAATTTWRFTTGAPRPAREGWS